ncbi:MAG: exodeoxyribonuclease VII large subunit [Verrucomicrobia bacterium]|nr:exodeoxyribonuclease VII large subunit [Verrucomicrobiota bacterium]
MPISPPLSVSELCDVIKGRVNGMGTVEVIGEISSYKTYPSGHHYFSVKDSETKIDCILYGFQAKWIKFPLRDGLAVILKAKVDFYGKNGKLSLVVDSMKPAGEGELRKKYLELLEKLKAEGLFDDSVKRPIPDFPKVVAFVTSEIGAVWHDFTEILKTRGWQGTAWLVPARVQGESCAGSVIAGLKQANSIPGIDLIVVGRGGGSMEDLWGFNDEALVRAVRSSPVPVISAIGHQTDFTLSDYAADKRAETPTAAAELIVSGQIKLREKIKLLGAQLAQHSPKLILQSHYQNLDLLFTRLESIAEEFLAEKRHRLSELGSELHRLSPKAHLSVTGEKLKQLGKRLQSAGFESILARGYSIVRDSQGKVITSSKSVKSGLKLRLKFSDGEAGVIGE